MASLNSHTEFDHVTAKDSFLKNPDLMAMTLSHLQGNDEWLFNVALTCKDVLDVALDALWEKLDSLVPLLKLLPALQVKDGEYVLNGNVSQADWDRLQYYSRKVKIFGAIYPDDPGEVWSTLNAPNASHPQVHSSTYVRIAQLQSSALFPHLRHLHYNLADRSISHIFLFLSPLLDSLELTNIGGFESTIVGPFLANLSSPMLSRIALNSGRMSADILKNSIVHFKQLRSLELTVEVFMSDFVLWEVLGTLPSLVDLTLKAIDPASNSAHVPENSRRQSGGPEYFVALESLCVTGSFFLIQDLLDFIDSPCLKSIKIYLVINKNNYNFGIFYSEYVDNFFSPSMTIVASKWSTSLKKLVINPISSGPEHRYAIPKCLTLLNDFHEMESFCLTGWKMENMDDDVIRMAMSWPKLRILILPLDEKFISLSTLRMIAEKCPELRRLHIRLDASTIPPFDTPGKSLRHNLEVLTLGSLQSYNISLKCQIQLARHLDFIFPYLESIKVQDRNWSDIWDLVKLCQDVRRDQIGQ